METENEVLGPAATFQHDHPIINVNQEFEKELTVGQKVADRVVDVIGSWPFVIIQSIILAIWVAVNVYLVTMAIRNPGFLKAWDPYPFILLNLFLSLQAAYTGPLVMMSQNRQAIKDRLSAQQDFEINQKAEKEIEVIMKHLAHQDRIMHEITRRLDGLQSESK
jgi:uncharacterized membrane protein